MFAGENLGIEDPEMIDLIKQELVTGWNASAVLARVRQQQVAAANSRIETAMIEGVGQHTMSIDADAYHFWNWREPGCWGDKAFRREYLRDNPAVAAPKTDRKIQITNRWGR